MSLSVSDCTAAIRRHTEGLAAVAEGNLDARVEHCPDWSVADLVWHLTTVHRFWNVVASDLPTAPPESEAVAPRPADEGLLVPGMLAAMETMVATLRDADQAAPCWTWGLEENVGFITRHQVQEAAVHHWDAANSAGAAWEMDPVVAMDAVDEFLTHSVANTRWPSPDAEPLGGTLWFCACVGETAEAETWVITDGNTPGTLTHRTFHLGEDAPESEGNTVGGHGSAQDFLLWLYGRVDDPTVDGDWRGGRALLERFRAFTNTD